jgi:transcriptional regulator with XRE-family HTH domain
MRVAAGLSQHQLARLAKCSRGTIAAIETDVPKTVKFATLQGIAAALNTTPDELARHGAIAEGRVEYREDALETFLQSLGDSVTEEDKSDLRHIVKRMRMDKPPTPSTYLHLLEAARTVRGDKK